MKLRYQMRGLGIGIIITALLMGVSKGDKLPLSDAEIKARALELGMVESNSLKLTDLPNTVPISGGASEPGEGGEQSAGQEGQEPGSGLVGSGAPGSGEPSGEGNAGTSGQGGFVQPAGEGSPDASGSGESVEGGNPGASGPGGFVQPAGEGSAGTSGQEGSGESAGEGSPDESGSGESAEGGASEPETVSFVIESGMSSDSVSRKLAEAGLVADAGAFDNYICRQGYSQKIHSGSYEIVRGTSEEEILKIITNSR